MQINDHDRLAIFNEQYKYLLTSLESVKLYFSGSIRAFWMTRLSFSMALHWLVLLCNYWIYHSGVSINYVCTCSRRVRSNLKRNFAMKNKSMIEFVTNKSSSQPEHPLLKTKDISLRNIKWLLSNRTDPHATRYLPWLDPRHSI